MAYLDYTNHASAKKFPLLEAETIQTVTNGHVYETIGDGKKITKTEGSNLKPMNNNELQNDVGLSFGRRTRGCTDTSSTRIIAVSALVVGLLAACFEGYIVVWILSRPGEY